MKKDDMITYLLIGGGVYALYWYVSNYGPAGKVAVSGGKGSYWDSWFGATTAAAGAAAPVSGGGGSGTNVAGTGVPPQSLPPSPPVSTNPIPPPNKEPPTYTSTPASGPGAASSLSASLKTAAAPATSLDIDQWSYYVAQISSKPLSGDAVSLMLQAVGGNRSATMSADTFVSILTPALAGQTPPMVVSAMGDITPTSSFRQSQGGGMSGSGRVRSPWGRLPIPGGYVN